MYDPGMDDILAEMLATQRKHRDEMMVRLEELLEDRKALDATIEQARGLIKRLDDQIAFMQAGAPRHIVPARQPRGTLQMAANAVYQRLCAERGRRFKATELEAESHGQKVRLIAYHHNRLIEQGMVAQPIEIEGANKNRTYFVDIYPTK